MPLEVFSQRTFIAEFIRFEYIFIHKNDKFTFIATFGFEELRGNVRTSSIARWKAHGRLPIRDN